MATLTPYRYPGAKNKILPILNEYIDNLLVGADSFCDAFVGGGSVLLNVASRYPKMQLFANDKDYWVYSFWNVLASEDTSKVVALLSLMETNPTLEIFYKLRAEATRDEIACAYRSIFFNRTTFSGIAYSGPIGGKGQTGKYMVDCRYNFKKLKSKILHAHKLLSGRTTVTNKSFEEYNVINSNTPLYLDPPYYNKGDSLYIEKMSGADHTKLAAILCNRPSWVLSYDDCPEIRALYSNNQVIDLAARYCINGKKVDWKDKNELIILPK